MPLNTIKRLGDDSFKYKFEIDNKIFSSETKLVRDLNNNQLIATSPKSIRNIIYGFYSHKGEVLTKEQLQSMGWPNKNISNSSIIVAIYDIRSLLGENKIITVTKEGYIFI